MILNKINLSKFKSISVVNLIFFLFWPLGTLLFNLKNRNVFEKKTIFLLFLSFLGFVFIYGDLKNVSDGADSKRYAYDFINMSNRNTSFTNLTSEFYSDESGITDIYSTSLMYFISRFTADPRFFFMMVSLFFSWFYINNVFIILSLLKKINSKSNLILKFLFASLILIIPIWYINSFRFWTASHVFIYGIFALLFFDNKKGYLFIAASAFIHFSFLYIIFLYVVYRLIPKWNLNLLFVGFLIAAFSSELKINLPSILHADILPNFLFSRFETYTNQDYVLMLGERTYAWHKVLADSLGRYIPISLVILLYLSGFKNSQTVEQNKLSVDSLVLYKFLLFASIITSLIGGVAEIGRFMLPIRFMFYGIAIIHFFQLVKFKKILMIMIPFFLFYIVFQIRTGTDYYGILSIFGNPFLALLLDTQAPIIDTVKEFLN